MVKQRIASVGSCYHSLARGHREKTVVTWQELQFWVKSHRFGTKEVRNQTPDYFHHQRGKRSNTRSFFSLTCQSMLVPSIGQNQQEESSWKPSAEEAPKIQSVRVSLSGHLAKQTRVENQSDGRPANREQLVCGCVLE